MLRSATFSSRLLLALGVGMVGALSVASLRLRPTPTVFGLTLSSSWLPSFRWT